MDDIDAFLDEKPADIDAFLDSKAPGSSVGVESPLSAAADGLQRLNSGLQDAAVAAATPIAAPVDAAIKRADESLALPKIPTIQKTAEGDVHGDLLPDLLAQFSGKVIGGMTDEMLGSTPDPAKRLVKDYSSGVIQLASGTGGALRVAGFENVGQMMAKSAQETAKNLMPPDPNIVDQVAQGLGSMTAFMVPGLGISGSATAVATIAPRLAMFMGVATSSVLEAGVEAGDVYNRVMDKTGDKAEANVAAGRAFFANLPLIHYTNKLGWAGDQSSRAARALESFFTEGLQEGGQEWVANMASNDPVMKGVIEAAFVGGIVGGAAGAVVHSSVNSMRHPAQELAGAPPQATPTAGVSETPAALQEAPAEPQGILAPAEVAAMPEPIPAAPAGDDPVAIAQKAVQEAEAVVEQSKGKERKAAKKALVAAQENLVRVSAEGKATGEAGSEAPVAPVTAAGVLLKERCQVHLSRG